jgi:hypothetical protein
VMPGAPIQLFDPAAAAAAQGQGAGVTREGTTLTMSSREATPVDRR